MGVASVREYSIFKQTKQDAKRLFMAFATTLFHQDFCLFIIFLDTLNSQERIAEKDQHMLSSIKTQP